ncbi:YvrJ family protein [Desulfofalx alkaliphila]|uniref:YvrJ family protein n=1 Tax=Desulfofalx alkaliphila TaxID=105483 RepID=UPI0004E17007|nr:YvrJ family protein [Desulfofalx alkaliphila]
MEELLQAIGNYGFPMVIAGYLLVRMEPVIRDLQRSVTLLTMVVARQSDIDVEHLKKIVDGKW